MSSRHDRILTDHPHGHELVNQLFGPKSRERRQKREQNPLAAAVPPTPPAVTEPTPLTPPSQDPPALTPPPLADVSLAVTDDVAKIGSPEAILHIPTTEERAGGIEGRQHFVTTELVKTGLTLEDWAATQLPKLLASGTLQPGELTSWELPSASPPPPAASFEPTPDELVDAAGQATFATRLQQAGLTLDEWLATQRPALVTTGRLADDALRHWPITATLDALRDVDNDTPTP